MQQGTVTFYNQGELDIRAVTTFGLSVKKNENPIGYFGTGLKYAIAVLLREGCEIEIFSGEDHFQFFSEKSTFRDEECELIYMATPDNGKLQLPFTLALGRNWEIWQAYRELYCNAIDEPKGGVCDKHDDIRGMNGHTFIAVRGDKFYRTHKTRSEFINSDTPIVASEKVDIVKTPGAFLKGIKISSSIYYPPMYGYNFHSGITLTEDRTLKEPIEAEFMAMDAIIASDDYDFIESILKADEGTFEHQIGWSGITTVSESFLRVITSIAKYTPDKLTHQAIALERRLNKNDSHAEAYELTVSQTESFARAIDFLERQGIGVEDFPIKFVKTLGEGIWGRAKSGTIFISAQCFDYGTKCLVATIYEEHLHLSRDFRDCSRNMQNHLFHTIVGLWESADGTSL